MKAAMKYWATLACVGLGVALANGCASTRYQQSTGEYIDSKTIAAKVKTALIEDHQVSGMDINVDVWKDNVQLNGFVDTAEQKQRAETLAWNVAGVRNVQNNLLLKDRLNPGSAAGSAPMVENATEHDAQLVYARILANPSYYYGKRAAIAGKVDVIFSPYAFTLQSPQGISDRELLVISPKGLGNVTPHDQIRVEGTLERFNRQTAEDKVGRPLHDEKFEDWNEKPVLYLDSMSHWDASANSSDAAGAPKTNSARSSK